MWPHRAELGPGQGAGQHGSAGRRSWAAEPAALGCQSPAAAAESGTTYTKPLWVRPPLLLTVCICSHRE